MPFSTRLRGSLLHLLPLTEGHLRFCSLTVLSIHHQAHNWPSSLGEVVVDEGAIVDSASIEIVWMVEGGR